jgi:hypothetical protein
MGSLWTGFSGVHTCRADGGLERKGGARVAAIGSVCVCGGGCIRASAHPRPYCWWKERVGSRGPPMPFAAVVVL